MQKKSRRIYNKKVKPFFITIRDLGVFLRPIKFYLQAKRLYFELHRLFNLLAK